MVTMKMKELEDGVPEECVPHLPWMRHPVDIDSFSGCPVTSLPRLDPRLAEALQRMGIESFFLVQVSTWLETIGPGAFQRDICINSPTGSGKTLAYALPIVQALSTRKVRCLRALVVLPTRDLALQVKEVFDAIAPVMGLTVASAIGRSSIADEISDLIKKSKQELYPSLDDEYVEMEPQTKVDILVATPGRLMDHINMTKGFSLEHLQYLVVDETDRIKLSQLELHHPLLLNSGKKRYRIPKNMESYKLSCVGRSACFFTKSVDDSHRLSTLLGFFEDLPFKFESTRRKTLAAFKEGKIDVLIGSDIMMLQYVKTYIHQAGRTARAGESGSCFMFLRKNETMLCLTIIIVNFFDKMLKKAYGSSCILRSLPEESIESLPLEKLKGSVEPESSKKSNKSGDFFSFSFLKGEGGGGG
ncbi:hypothetical protein VPH35_044934 [Triticum aestivum]